MHSNSGVNGLTEGERKRLEGGGRKSYVPGD